MEEISSWYNGYQIMIDIERGYFAGQKSPACRKDIYAAMIVYGLLSYYEGELRIPNKELMMEFEAAPGDDDFGSEL